MRSYRMWNDPHPLTTGPEEVWDTTAEVVAVLPNTTKRSWSRPMVTGWQSVIEPKGSASPACNQGRSWSAL